MKFDSPLFDCIRVKPDEDRRRSAELPACDWPDCRQSAPHRAPKGRGREREYWRFCLDHVRQYNHSYNYFAGMSADAVANYQKDALTGHLPTWKMGMVGGNGRVKGKARGFDQETGAHPFDILREVGGHRAGTEYARAEAERRTVRNAERKALHA